MFGCSAGGHGKESGALMFHRAAEPNTSHRRSTVVGQKKQGDAAGSIWFECLFFWDRVKVSSCQCIGWSAAVSAHPCWR